MPGLAAFPATAGPVPMRGDDPAVLLCEIPRRADACTRSRAAFTPALHVIVWQGMMGFQAGVHHIFAIHRWLTVRDRVSVLACDRKCRSAQMAIGLYLQKWPPFRRLRLHCLCWGALCRQGALNEVLHPCKPW